MIYIATFYSHFGAMRFKKQCDKCGVSAKIMPVPRDLSSSCGTCVRYDSENPCPIGLWTEEIELVVMITQEGYVEQYRAENS